MRTASLPAGTDTRRLIRQAEALRARLLRRMIARTWRRLLAAWAARGAEAELRGLDTRELADLGIGRGGIAHAARHGRKP